MKEVVYAWYPPAIDAYKSNRETGLDSYTKECLYRYNRSRFTDPHQCCSVREETTGQGQRMREETPWRGQRDEPPANGGLVDEVELKSAKISFRPRPPSAEPALLSVRSKSAAVEGKPGMVSPEVPGPCRRLQRVGSSNRGRASSAWVKSRGWLAETSTSCGVAFKDLAPEVTSPRPVQAHQPPQVPSSSAFRLPTHDGHAARVQSAVIRRPGSQVVKRSVQSAGPERLTPTVVDPSPAVVWGATADREEHIRRRPRPSGPTPRRWREDEEGEGTGEAAVDGLGMEFPLDYDEQVKIHGWKMEVPGDPLRIKRGCLAKRLSTTIVLPLEEVSRKPGRSHIQSSDTFFYNTIPRMPMTFTIHPDWSSEILQTKRMELKAKTGADGGGHRGRICRMADFSFVY